MKQIERTDEEPYFPEDDMTDEEYETYCERMDKEIGERDEYYDKLRKERRMR
ncbi:MAG: hypothetical protein K2H46_03965 [Muribaculaceae bacterium]|nr:hypothetical protein [Muribaculaceae bacterium]